MVDFIQIIQALVGVVLFFAAGYFLSLVFFRKDEADQTERIVYSVVFALTLPPLTIFFLNFLLGIPINTLMVMGVYLIFTGGSYFYYNNYGDGKNHKG